MVEIGSYDEVRTCVYAGETYSVRDNGAIMRHAVVGKKKRPNDEKWTFGKFTRNGYMYFCGIGVHRIVATAFHGKAPSSEYVCDHYDTNRSNNRPENLRWVTKLENLLNNPYTHEKIVRVCGSIDEFLKNPDKFYDILNQNKSHTWMRAVSQEEAKNTLANMDKWLDLPSKESEGCGFNGSVFEAPNQEKRPVNCGKDKRDFVNTKSNEHTKGRELTWESIRRDLSVKYADEISVEYADEMSKPIPDYVASLTPNALQPSDWTTAWNFPNCPKEKNLLEQYYKNLKKGNVFNYNRFGKTVIEDYARTPDGNIIVKCKMPEHVVLYGCLTKIRLAEDGKYIHENKGTYWYPDGIEKYFLIEQGKEWTGGDVMDDYL